MAFQDDFGSGNYTLNGGQISPNKLWKCIYTGFGTVGVQLLQNPTNGRTGSCMSIRPQVNQSGTSACLVLSEPQFGDFDTEFYMRTFASTRSSPRNWETAWFMFRYTDNTHHYYFYIGRNGNVEIGKKDYVKVGTNQIKTPDGKVTTVNNQDQQVFLKTDGKVVFTLQKWYKIRLIVKGYNIKLYIDDKLIADITDNGTTGSWLGQKVNFKPSTTMLKGKLGMYGEDSNDEYDNIIVNDLAVPTPPPVPPTPTPTEQVYCAIIGSAEVQRAFKTEKGCDEFVASNGNIYTKRAYPLYP